MKKLMYILLALAFSAAPLLAQNYPTTFRLDHWDFSLEEPLINNPALIQYRDSSTSPYGELRFTKEPESFARCIHNATVNCNAPLSFQLCSVSYYEGLVLVLKYQRDYFPYSHLSIQFAKEAKLSPELLEEICTVVPAWFEAVNRL